MAQQRRGREADGASPAAQQLGPAAAPAAAAPAAARPQRRLVVRAQLVHPAPAPATAPAPAPASLQKRGESKRFSKAQKGRAWTPQSTPQIEPSSDARAAGDGGGAHRRDAASPRRDG
eukprot:6440979-Prymnesium_polylepis.1